MDYKLIKIQMLILLMSNPNATVKDLSNKLKELGY